MAPTRTQPHAELDLIHKTRILAPGPTPTLNEAIQASLVASLSGIHHRGPEFRQLLESTRRGLQSFMRTKNDVIVLTSSGTGAMEACIVNSIGAGEEVIVVSGGRFGDRWAAIARAYGATVIEFTVKPSDAFDVAAFQEAVHTRAESLRAVVVCGVETSTGALADVHAIADTVRTLKDCLLIVDGMTWLGAHQVDPDVIGIDLLIGGSSKALSGPPGASFVAVSPRAIARAESMERGRYYFDLIRELEGQREGLTAFTPAVPTIAAMSACLTWVDSLRGGVKALVRNAETLAAAARAAFAVLECELYPKVPAASLTVARPPEGITSGEVLRDLRGRFGWIISDGQAKMKGRIFRVGHMGWTDSADLLGFVGALELVLIDRGLGVRPGKAVAAAQEVIAHFYRIDKDGA